MKILVVSQYWYPENGVPQRRWVWLTRVLQEAGHEVAAVAPPPHYKRRVSPGQWMRGWGYRILLVPEPGPNGETIYRSGYFPAGSSLTQRIASQGWTALAMIAGVTAPAGPLRRFQPDLVIGTVPALPTAIVASLAAKRFGAPYIVDLRDAWPALFRDSHQWNRGVGEPSVRERLLSKGPMQVLLWAAERAIQRVLDGAAGIVTTSLTLEKQVPHSNGQITATVRNVFPAGSSQASKLQAARPQSSGLNILYAGTLGRAQRLENALRATSILQSEYGIRVNLKLIGDGAARPALEALARELPADVELLDQRSPEQLKQHYEWADTALVHLTGWQSLNSAIPSKTYELMQMGVHITAVVSGEAADLISELGAGDVVHPDDPAALAKLWAELSEDPGRLRVNGRGRAWVENEREVVAPARLVELVDAVHRQTRGGKR